jgi:hypothetical protein
MSKMLGVKRDLCGNATLNPAGALQRDIKLVIR